MTANDVTQALQGQNIQVASGVLNQPPVDKPGAFQIAVQTLGRLADPEEFANIVVKQTAGRGGAAEGRRADRARRAGLFVELLSRPQTRRSRSRSSSGPARTRSRPRDAIREDHGRAVEAVPAGRQARHRLRSDPVHPPVGQRGDRDDPRGGRCSSCWWSSLFLQTWRAAIIPIVAIPVSLIGTFFFMATFGFTLNNLSLFGLVLAVGIVVDDAIVVVENVERNIADGL